MNAERAAGPAGHNLKLKRKNKKNKSASFLSQCGISYDHKAKNFKMKKQKATSHKRQASSAIKKTQLNNRIKK